LQSVVDIDYNAVQRHK
jgi:AP-1 complex subunit gamma-1